MLGDGAEQSDELEAADGALRLCAVTRQRRSPDELIRFVPAPDGSIVPDLLRRLPGRGVWVSATREAIEAAVKTKAFARSLKRDVTVWDDLAARVEHLIARRVAEAISLANKAGLVTCGFAKLEGEIAAGRISVLLHGSDAAADGRGKLDRRLFAVMKERQSEALVLECLTIEELSLAIGRPNVVHAGLRNGGATRRVVLEAERLRRYRSGIGASEGQP